MVIDEDFSYLIRSFLSVLRAYVGIGYRRSDAAEIAFKVSVLSGLDLT